MAVGDESRATLYWKLIRSSPWYHQLFIVLVVLQVLYLTIERCVLFSFVNFSDETAVRDAVFWMGIILISTFFSGYYAIHSMLTVNYMELAAYRALTLWLLIRLVVEYVGRADEAECRGARGSITCLAFLCVGAAFNVLTIGLTFFMLPDLRWKRYKAIGAEVDTQVMYRRFEVFSAVRKVDLQFAVTTLYTGLVYCSFNLGDTTAQYTLGANVALIFIEGVWEWLGDTGVKSEAEGRLYLFWGLSVFLPSFIINVAIDAFTDNSILALATSREVRITIGVFALLAVTNRILTVACSVALYVQFGTPRYAGLRRIFDGGRMAKFSRGRLTTTTSSSSVAAAAGAGGAPTAEGRMAAGAGVGSVRVLNPSRSAGPGGGAVELEMGDLGAGGRDPWRGGAAVVAAPASGPGRGAGGGGGGGGPSAAPVDWGASAEGGSARALRVQG